MKSIFKRLNQKGFAHHFVFGIIVVAVAVGGTFYLVASHADSTAEVASSPNGSVNIQACQHLTSSVYGNIYQVTLTYTKPASDSGFYGFSVVDGRTNTNRSTNTGTNYTSGVSGELTASASQVANDYISVFEDVNGTNTSNIHVNPSTLPSCGGSPNTSVSALPAAATQTANVNDPAAAKEFSQTVAHTQIDSPHSTLKPAIGVTSTGGAEISQSNWSGYVASPNTYAVFNSVTGFMIVPNVTQAECAQTYNYGMAFFWSGLDGWNQPDVEQDGIAFSCNPTGTGSTYQPQYQAWYEMYPQEWATVYHFNTGAPFNVNPGDVIEMQVSYYYGSYVMVVTDITNNQSNTAIQTCNGGCTRASAEWVDERPTMSNGTVWVMPDFGSTQWFWDQASDSSKGDQGIASFPYNPLRMVDSSGNTLAHPTELNNSSGFYDYWNAAQ